MENDIPDLLPCTTLSGSSALVVQVGTLPHFWIKGKAKLPIGLWLLC